MTLCIAWVRQIRATEELVVISDRRVTGGLTWDACPKIFTFARKDCAIAFAHSTIYAYPAIEQIRTTVDSIPKVKNGASDLGYVRRVALHVLESMRTHISNRSPGVTDADDIDTQFILAGFDWRTQGFKLWRIYFSVAKNKFWYESAGPKRQIIYAGDEDVVKDARSRIGHFVRTRRISRYFDMEPFEVLRDICREERYYTVRGPVQLLKVYKHHNAMPYCVYWPDRGSKTLTLLGRTLLDFEDLPFFRLDPDSLEASDSFEYLPR